MKWLGGLTPGGAGIWTVVGLIAVGLIRQKPITQKLQNEREGNLLKERAAEMRRMRRRIAQLEAEQRADRHTLGNVEQCFDALLMAIELNPERAGEAVVKVKAMRDRMKMEEAAEKGELLRASVEKISLEDEDADK